MKSRRGQERVLAYNGCVGSQECVGPVISLNYWLEVVFHKITDFVADTVMYTNHATAFTTVLRKVLIRSTPCSGE